jgi:hypothetical protein
MSTAGNVAHTKQVLFLTDENNLDLERVDRVPQESCGEKLQIL